MAAAEALGSSCPRKLQKECGLKSQTREKESPPRTSPRYSSPTIQQRRRGRALGLPLSRKQLMIMAAQLASVQRKAAALRLRSFCPQNQKEEERMKDEG